MLVKAKVYSANNCENSFPKFLYFFFHSSWNFFPEKHIKKVLVRMLFRFSLTKTSAFRLTVKSPGRLNGQYDFCSRGTRFLGFFIPHETFFLKNIKKVLVRMFRFSLTKSSAFRLTVKSPGRLNGQYDFCSRGTRFLGFFIPHETFFLKNISKRSW